MSFRELTIKKAYNSDSDDILSSFYIPTLSKSIEYNRLAGFFTSNSLAIAAKGILGLIKNSGKINLITSPYLSKDDAEIIKNSTDNPDTLANILNRQIKDVDEKFIHNHLQALAFMLANGLLNIKIAIIFDNENNPLTINEIEQTGIFHQKVGILKDPFNNIISFSGSINETASAWRTNIEEFKVFRSWIPGENEYIISDQDKFNNFWHDKGKNLHVYDLPEAVEKEILKFSPRSFQELEKSFTNTIKPQTKKISLYDYQLNAIDSWIQNDYKGIFEMATGTGKTYTALGCLQKVLYDEKKIITIISCPYGHLLTQWIKELVKFGIDHIKVVCDSSNHNWADDLFGSMINNYYLNKSLIIFTTHTTLSSPKFREVINNFQNNHFFLIADEVHSLGAEINRNGLIDKYSYRLALSATPKRWFDEKGTEFLYTYFDKVVYSFPLQDAINKINPSTNLTFLTPYEYVPKFVSLDGKELEEYIEVSQKISQTIINNKGMSIFDDNDQLKFLLFKRANIIKNAKQKISVLSEVTEEIRSIQGNLFGTLIYCSPQQIDDVINALNQQGVIFNKITMEEGTSAQDKYNNISERDFILQNFGKGDYEVLVAMKCLDEGVDIPQARNAILLASSGNPREYIQRIGRVIRRSDLKSFAYIYDVIVKPSLNILSEDIKKVELKIYKKELERCKEIASNARNNSSAIRLLNDQIQQFYEKL